jgi:hypothetical protein
MRQSPMGNGKLVTKIALSSESKLDAAGQRHAGVARASQLTLLRSSGHIPVSGRWRAAPRNQRLRDGWLYPNSHRLVAVQNCRQPAPRVVVVT